MTTRRIFPSLAIPASQAALMPRVKSITNHARNPKAGNATGNMHTSTSAGTGGAVTPSKVAAGGPFASAPSFQRLTWTTAPTGGNVGAVIGQGGNEVLDLGTPTPAAGTQIFIAIWVRWSVNAAAFQISGTFSDATSATLVTFTGVPAAAAANAWTPLMFSGTLPANTRYVHLNVTWPSTYVPIVAGTTLDYTALQVVTDVPNIQGFADGDGNGWAWAGTPNNSKSSGPALILP